MDNESASIPEPIDSSLCDVCKGMFKVENGRSSVTKMSRYVYAYVHHAHIVALRASAEAGCCLCTFFINRLKKSDAFFECERDAISRSVQRNSETPTTQPDEDAFIATQLAELERRQDIYNLSGSGVRGRGRIVIRISYDRQSRLWWKPKDRGLIRVSVLNTCLGAYFQYLHIPYDAVDLNLEHRPSKDLLSEPHIALINRWRRICRTEHESCNMDSLTQPLPSRILELLDPNDENHGVRLVETQGKMWGVYTCVSYCWGDSQIQTGQTIRHNHSRQLQGIPLRDLPRTVIDAIRLCYKLGFRFLWVDRLCIVQDDEKDWSQEASRMCEVYSRSALTISVPICKESSQSFLAERRKGFREQSRFFNVTLKEAESKCKSSVWFHDSLRREDGPWFLEHEWDRFASGENSLNNRWLDRGWTFQEWMLSPRVLHIDSITLWDCFDGYANELNYRYMEVARLLRNPIEFGKGISWDSIVTEYSHRKFNCKEDKLPALAGLAARYAQATGHIYLAGLWLEDLPRSLLWGALEPRGPGSRSAPSWSWASSHGEVMFEYDPGDFTARASILSFFCQYNPPGSFVAVEKAWIDVEGRVSTVTAQQCRARPRWDGEVRVEGDEYEWWYATDHGDRFPDDSIDQANVCLLLVGSSSEPVDGDEFVYHALVLQKCGWEDDQQCYQRLGSATLYISEDELMLAEVGASWEARVVHLV